jgi:hypothetical protein
MSGVHSFLGAVTIFVNAAAAAIGIGLFVVLRGAAAAPRNSGTRAFWVLLRAGQGLVLVDAVIGAALLLDGKELPPLHLIYGLVPIAVSFVAEQLRLASADIELQKRDLENARQVATLPEVDQHKLVAGIIRRETGVMAASAGVVALLCLRAQGWL